MPRTMPKQKPGRSKQNYATPEDLIRAVKARLGIKAFKFDFAADKKNAKARSWWNKQDDALAQRWTLWVLACRMGWGWLNPPFARIGKWAKKCLAAHKHGAQIAFLVPASVGSNWYRDYIHEQPGVKVLSLNGRPSFDGKAGFPKDAQLVLFDGKSKEPFSSDVWTWRDDAA